MRKLQSFVFEQRLIILVLVVMETEFEIKRNSFAPFQQPAKFQRNRRKTPEILQFHLFIVLQDCVNGDIHLAQIADFGVHGPFNDCC